MPDCAEAFAHSNRPSSTKQNYLGKESGHFRAEIEHLAAPMLWRPTWVRCYLLFHRLGMDGKRTCSSCATRGESGANWRGQEEFEGSKSYTPSGAPCEYQYLHGPLCNALHRKLDELIDGHPELRVGKHRVDLALVDRATDKARVIFEVKTSASMSTQLYTAVGQLAYYRHCFGNADTKLILVLPASTASDFAAAEFFDDANIQVLFGEAGVFENSKGESLEKVLSSIL